MKSRDVILGYVSGLAYFGYSGMRGDLAGQITAVTLLAVVGAVTSLYCLVKGRLD